MNAPWGHPSAPGTPTRRLTGSRCTTVAVRSDTAIKPLRHKSLPYAARLTKAGPKLP